MADGAATSQHRAPVGLVLLAEPAAQGRLLVEAHDGGDGDP
jgi:hypothetical protein